MHTIILQAEREAAVLACGRALLADLCSLQLPVGAAGAGQSLSRVQAKNRGHQQGTTDMRHTVIDCVLCAHPRPFPSPLCWLLGWQ